MTDEFFFATELGRFHKLLGEDGAVELLARTMEVAVTLKFIAMKELTRVIVDSTVQEKAIAHPTDSKLVETARSKVVEIAKANDIEPKQTYAKEGQLMGYEAGRYAHARRLMHMRKSRNPYELGLRVGLAMTLRSYLIAGARSFPGNPYDGRTMHFRFESAPAQGPSRQPVARKKVVPSSRIRERAKEVVHPSGLGTRLACAVFLISALG